MKCSALYALRSRGKTMIVTLEYTIDKQPHRDIGIALRPSSDGYSG